ncbi:MAG: alpha/beta fold hydrolase [Candidatus Cloacimonetes bacterium]|nr:alpha/beta fold hydrolase [Candidatus Cloacimonadota bacterium]
MQNQAETTVDIQKIAEEIQKFNGFLKNSEHLKELRESARKKMSPTPREVLYREHSTTLYYYPPLAGYETRLSHPLLIIPSLVNKPCIMDLMKGESFIGAMLQGGSSVYMLEWGEPTLAQSRYSLYKYLFSYIGRAVRRIITHSGKDSLNLAGYCLGGALSVLYSALARSQNINSLITMVTPVNFHDKGLLSFWAKEEHFNVDKLVDTWGNIPADFFASCFPWLVPTANLKKMRMIYDKHDNDEFMEAFFALDIWLTENIPFPGEVYREIIKQGYQQNSLASTGTWNFGNSVIANLNDICVPVLNLTATYDHVSPPESCSMLTGLLKNSHCQQRDYPIGHLGIALGKDAKNKPTKEYWNDILTFLGDVDCWKKPQ